MKETHRDDIIVPSSQFLLTGMLLISLLSSDIKKVPKLNIYSYIYIYYIDIYTFYL